MIDVLFFAELQESLGKGKITVQASGLTIDALKKKYLQAYDLPNIDQAMVAINEEYAQESTVLSEGDTVAFIPPVSGG